MKLSRLAPFILSCAVVMSASVALAQATGGDPTAAFTARTTQLESIISIIGASILGIVDLVLVVYGAIRGQLQWPWLILVTLSAIIVGSFSVWKTVLVG